MSYVNKKIRAFKEAGDIEVNRKRSDGRMKTYQSATDARAWCGSIEDRRQHILDLVRQGDGKGLSLGKYIPIEAIIDILLANKNADIKRLQEEIERLKKLIKGNQDKSPKEVVTIVPPKKLETSQPAESESVTKKEVDEKPTPKKVEEKKVEEKKVEEKKVEEEKVEEKKVEEKKVVEKKESEPIEYEDEDPTEQEETEQLTQDETGKDISPIESSEDDRIVSKGTRRRRPITEEEEKAAQELLDGKSPDEQIDALKNALAEKEKLYALQHAIAAAAIEQLENIRDIVGDKDSGKNMKTKDMALPKSPSVATSRRGEEGADEIAALEKEIETMKSSSSPEKEIIQREIQVESSPLVQDLRTESENLKRRLEALQGLEDEVRKLKGLSETKVQPAGDTSENEKLLAKIAELEKEIENLKGSLREMEILRVEKNCLKTRLDDLSKIQRDYEDLLKKTQGFDALKAELAMYKAEYEKLKDLEAECKVLRARAQRADELEHERQMLMKEIQDCECCMNNQEEEIKRLACHIDCLTQDLDKRQDQMKVKVLTLRAHLEKKDNIIAKSEQQLATVQDQLRNSIESLSCETYCLRNRIEELENEITRYENEITRYENKIKEYERRDNKIEEYENKIKQCENRIKESQRRMEEYEQMIKKCQETLAMKEESNKILLEKFENEKSAAARLEQALKKAVIGDEHLKQMLKQAKCAIRCITQKLEKHDIVDMAKMENEREKYMRKIKELEDTLSELAGGDGIDRNQLEQDLNNAKEIINQLRQNLENTKGLAEENESLKKLLSELQAQTPKDIQEILSKKSGVEGDDELREALAQKDQTIEELRKELFALKQQIEKEKALREFAEAALAEQSVTGGSDATEIAKLKAEIDILHAEIDRLNFDLEYARKTAEAGSDLGPRVQELEAENAKLKAENSELKAENDETKAQNALLKAENDELKSKIKDLSGKDDLSTDLERLMKENALLKEETENLKSQTGVADELNRLQQELDAKAKVEEENKNLKDEINRLKQELLTSKGQSDADVNKNLDEIDKLRKELSSREEQAEKEKQELIDEINRLKQEIALKDDAGGKSNKQLLDEINKLKTDLAAADKENKDLKDQINKLQQQLDDSNIGDKALQDELNKLRQELSTKMNLENENKNLKDELESLKASNAQNMGMKDADFAKERDELLKQIAAQKEEIAELLDKIKEPASTEDDALLKELQNKNKEIEQLKDTVNKLEDELRDCKDKHGKLDAKISDLEKQVSDKEQINNENEKLRKIIADLEQQQTSGKDQTDTENEKLRKIIADLEQQQASEKDQTNKENEKLRNTIADLEQQLKNLRNAQMESVSKGSPEVENVLNNLRESLEKEEQKNKELDEALRKCMEEGEDLKKKLAEREKESVTGDDAEYKQRISELEEKLAKQKEECDQRIAALNKHDVDEGGQPPPDDYYKNRCIELEHELAKQKEECKNMIQSLQKQYDRDVKNLRRQSEVAIDQLQQTEREWLQQLNRNHENERKALKEQLKNNQAGSRRPSFEISSKARSKQSSKVTIDPEVEKSAEEEQAQSKPTEEAQPVEEEPPVEETKSVEEEKSKVEPEKTEEKEEETPLEDKKEKKLSINTFAEVCICSKLPAVIPISPPPTTQLPAAAPTPQQLFRPCVCPQQPVSEFQMPRPIMPAPATQQFMPLQPMTYAATPTMMSPQFTSPSATPPNEERANSIKKLMELENKLLVKQHNTKQKIDELQNTVEKFKRELELEKQRNSDLICRYSNQSKTVENMKVEIDIVKKENLQDKQKLQQLNTTLKNILQSRGMMCTCAHNTPIAGYRAGIPHFHTELSVVKTDDNRYKHNCIMKRAAPCPCSAGDKSSDSYEIDE